MTFDKCEFYEISKEDSEVSYYFSYPQAGSIGEGNDVLTMDYMNCSVEFGEGLNYEPDSNDFIEVKTHEKNAISYQAWYKDGLLIRYGGSLANYDYKFWLSDEESGVSDCILVLETMAESFTDTPFYHNKDYGFKIDLLPDYKMEYLPSGEGVLMKKWVEGVCMDEWGEEYECGYKVEIYVFASENVMQYQNLGEFLADKYSGFSAEFVNYNGRAGVFIDEGSGEDAIRHFFAMSDDTSIVYEAYLKVPSIYYTDNAQEFSDLMATLQIFFLL